MSVERAVLVVDTSHKTGDRVIDGFQNAFSKALEVFKRADLEGDTVHQERALSEIGSAIREVAMAGRFDIAKAMIAELPTSYNTEPLEGGISPKLDILFSFVGFLNHSHVLEVGDILDKRDKELANVSSDERAVILETYGSSADAFLSSGEADFYFNFILDTFLEEKELVSAGISSPTVFQSKMQGILGLASRLGASQHVVNKIISVMNLSPVSKSGEALRNNAIAQAALRYACIETYPGGRERFAGPLAARGNPNIHMALALLNEAAIHNSDGKITNSSVADAYYALITTYSTELLEMGMTCRQIETIVESIRGAITKHSGQSTLDGHLEAIQEASHLAA